MRWIAMVPAILYIWWYMCPWGIPKLCWNFMRETYDAIWMKFKL